MESEAVADVAGSPLSQKPRLEEDSVAESADGHRSELPLPTTPPGEVPTGLPGAFLRVFLDGALGRH